MLGVLVSRELATRDAMMRALYGDDPDPPCERILRVFVYKLRRKLAPHGFTIVTRGGPGSPFRPNSARGCARWRPGERFGG